MPRVIMASTVALASAAPLQNWAGHNFDRFLGDFGKAYAEGAEHDLRRQHYEASLKEVLAQNVEYAQGRSSWYATLNEFSDWSEEEFGRLVKAKSTVDVGPHPVAPPLRASAPNPDRFDWRENNVVTPVKNQGSCGSCWAFASTAVLESHYAIATSNVVELAPQAYVNCAPNPTHCGGVGGCEGSISELAFNMSATLGMPLETDLPYHAVDETCLPYKAAVVNSGGYVKLPENDADALETAIATIGPMAVNVAASSWSRYGGGIFSGGCTSDDCILNHVVAAEGYGKEDGEGYWLIRNSWTSSWGEAGYIRLSRKDDATTFTDNTPASGVACEPFPQVQYVMGESGVLFDVAYPTGVVSAPETVAV